MASSPAKYSILDPEAPSWWLWERLSTEETAAELGITSPAAFRRFTRGELQFGLDAGDYFCCRMWIRQSWERAAEAKRRKLGLDDPMTKAAKPKSSRREREAAESAAVFGTGGK